MPDISFYDELAALRDEEYRAFNMRLVPGIDESSVIGIRVPALRALAKRLWKERNADCRAFLRALPHRYFEENHLHVFFLEQIKDIDEALRETEAFLPYIDNWQTCDISSPKVFKKHPDKVVPKVKLWLASPHCYAKRYAIGILLSNFLDAAFQPEYLEWVADENAPEYYVRMMAAWYFSFALIKQYDSAIPYIEQKRLEAWTHNKTIQKAIESYRISPETKAYLRTLKVKTAPGEYNNTSCPPDA